MEAVYRCTVHMEKETLKVSTDGDSKDRSCVWLVAGKCAYQRLSTVCRHYYVIGLLQPRYVMPNLVAIRLQEKTKCGEKNPYKLL